MSCNKPEITGKALTNTEHEKLLTASSLIRLRLSFRPGLVLNAVANGDQVLTEAVIINFSLLWRSTLFRVLAMEIMLYINSS
jgi:hypothetical protein